MCIVEIQWDVINSVSTMLAVLIALFLPFFQSWKKAKNIKNILENELTSNYEIVEKASTLKDSSFEGETISAINLKVPVLKSINLTSWDGLQNNFALDNSRLYIDFKALNSSLLQLKLYAEEIERSKGNSLYIHLIDHVIAEFLNNYKNRIT